MVEFDSDEKVLITSEKSFFIFYLLFFAFLFFSLIFFIPNLELTTLYDFIGIIISFIFSLSFIFLSCICCIYFLNNSVSLTNKRFIFRKGNKEENVNFSDVRSIFSKNNIVVVKDN